MDHEAINMKVELVEPLISYITRGTDDPDSCETVIEMLGDEGQSNYMAFKSHQLLGAIAELFWEASLELYAAKMYGLDDLIDRKGEMVDNSEADYTIEHMFVEDMPGGLAKKTESPLYPWFQRLDMYDEDGNLEGET